ncbi:MAG: NusG domain II-containing protein [Bacillota bacterium]|nr:NusG domain II-containing protein [Bacillota bacterium]
MDKSMIKKDILFLVCVISLALIVWGIYAYCNQNGADTVFVIQDGKQVGAYPLEEDKIVIVTWGEDEYNLLMISDGTAFMSDADCPDKLCVKQNPISGNGESIICLPHKLVIRIAAKEESKLDAVTY